MNKALIVYGIRYGAAARTAEEIASVLQREGFEAKVADAKREKIKDIASYDLIVVGSGIQINRWTMNPKTSSKSSSLSWRKQRWRCMCAVAQPPPL
ncbi:MAG: flavodoxin domain-containing protein [Candidatus Bathyarchaeia archaeon]